MSDNVFDKLDKQGETIDKIESKLDGISINDLYALAKRTWDYKDYETAQKYYNHISLLAPLEWKAPFYASLCGCLNIKDFPESIYCPRISYNYYVATIEYIESLDNTESDKVDSICKATKILLSVFQRFIGIYKNPDNKKIFDEQWPQYKENILQGYFDLIEKIEGKEDVSIKEITIQAINEYLSFIKECCAYLPAQLTREKIAHFIELSNYADKEFFFNMKYEEKPLESEKDLTEEQKVNIKVKGKCYLRFRDGVLTKRKFNKDLFCGLVLSLFAVIYMIVSVLSGKYLFALLQAVPFFYGMIFIIRAFIQKNRIKADSLLNFDRVKYRLTSENNAVYESIFSPMQWVIIIIPSVYFGTTFLPIIVFSDNVFLIIVGVILSVIISITGFFTVKKIDGNMTKEFDYEGKTYQFKDER